MTRGAIPDLHHPHSLVDNLPAAYKADEFTRRFVASFDDVLAPVLATVDHVDCYLDPRLAPPDFLPWLAGWVGIDLDHNWSDAQQRRLIATGVRRHAWRGTTHGLVDLVTQYLGLPDADVDVEESGAAAWAATPNAALPGSFPPTVTVTVRSARPDDVDMVRLRDLVTSAVPAHVRLDVRVVAT